MPCMEVEFVFSPLSFPATDDCVATVGRDPGTDLWVEVRPQPKEGKNLPGGRALHASLP